MLPTNSVLLPNTGSGPVADISVLPVPIGPTFRIRQSKISITITELFRTLSLKRILCIRKSLRYFSAI